MVHVYRVDINTVLPYNANKFVHWIVRRLNQMLLAEISLKIGSVMLSAPQIAIAAVVAVVLLWAFIFGDPITKTGRDIRRERRDKQIEKRLQKDADK